MSTCFGIWHIRKKFGRYRQPMNGFVYITSGVLAIAFFGVLIAYSCVSGTSYRYALSRKIGITRSEKYGLTRHSIRSARFEEMRDIPLL